DQDWRIYRAYTSLANALAGIENSAIGVNFDVWSARNLVTNNEQWNIALYGDNADSNSISAYSWTMSEKNYLRIFAPSKPSEVGVSQRHVGVWDNSKARIIANGAGGPLFDFWIDSIFVRIDGLQIRNEGPAPYEKGIRIRAAASSEIIVTNNL